MGIYVWFVNSTTQGCGETNSTQKQAFRVFFFSPLCNPQTYTRLNLWRWYGRETDGFDCFTLQTDREA